MTTRTRIAAATAAVTVFALTATGCSLGSNKSQQPYKDAPRSNSVNRQPMDVIEMSDGFSNVGAKCDGPNRVYVLFHNNDKYGGLAVVANDPRCTGR